ncbi:MAG: aldehyde dehydrogenase family protein [Planctomycetes bacterium]|nr:aldehyde dehydrogenase family protein [Planctomycetota bacterium]
MVTAHDRTTRFIPSWIDGTDWPPAGSQASAPGDGALAKHDPATGALQSLVHRGKRPDAERALAAARRAFEAWAATTPVRRGEALRRAVQLMESRREELASIVHRETGKSFKDAFGEAGAAIEMGYFVAGEGRRFYGKTTTSQTPGRWALVTRQPRGVAALITAANTPIANVAWKAFPALLCGNAAVMKASEDTPETAYACAGIFAEAGVPPGAFNVLQGLGEEAGAPLVESSEADIVSFTGSAAVGRWIAETAGRRLAKVCLELGGKNPLVVADDADLAKAVEGATLAAFSNAGQRCASGSRIIVFERIYDEFARAFVERAGRLKVGPADGDDFGPVINEGQLLAMLAAVERARREGARVLTGGRRLDGPAHGGGYYMAPTVLDGVDPASEASRSELFGPIVCLYRASGFEEALRLANDSPFGLTAAIYTRDVDRAMMFLARVRSGVAVANGPTYGSEPHMPFGGLKDSGNGTREAGAEALDVYSDLKTIYINSDPSGVK